MAHPRSVFASFEQTPLNLITTGRGAIKPAPFFLLAMLTCLLLSTQPTFAGDGGDCDFQGSYESGELLYSHQRVMDCFNSVPFAEADRDQAVEVIYKSRRRSPLRGVYNAMYNWESELAALGSQSFPSDYALQEALVRNHWSHFNGHYNYWAPRCYQNMLYAFIPVGYGSMIHQGSQIIFIDGVLGLPQPMIEAYEAELGFPLRELVGMKVESINGQPPLDHFRDVANSAPAYDDNDGAVLNSILNYGIYQLRSMSLTFPTQQEDVLELVSRSGKERRTVTLPWKFFHRGLIAGGAVPLSDSTESFVELCLEPNPILALPPGADTSPAALEQLGVRDVDRELREELAMRKELGRKARFSDVPASRGGFYEVPPGQRNKYLEDIGSGPSIRAFQHKDSATIIQLDNFVGPWRDHMLEYTAHACENSDTLLLDLTGNGGGFVAALEWLANHLAPPSAGELPLKTVSADILDLPKLQQGMFDIDTAVDNLVVIPRALEFFGIPLDVCTPDSLGFQPACRSDATTGLPFLDNSWVFLAWPEWRGDSLEWITPKNYRNSYPGFLWDGPVPPIACPGKFEEERLIILVDGFNGSAGYILPALLKDMATLVGKGGYSGEPLSLGGARGGTVVAVNNIFLNQQFALDLGIPLVGERLIYSRNVDSRYEDGGTYRENLTDLHATDPVWPHQVLPLWSSTQSPTTQGAIYTQVLKAIK